MNMCNSSINLEFDGNLEPANRCSTKLGKEHFVSLVRHTVETHGQGPFYVIKGLDGRVVHLYEYPHEYNFDAVIALY